jgi:hypothetical protein
VNAIQIVNVEQDGEDGILVTFSDGTVAGYVAEELIELRPIRAAVTASQGLSAQGPGQRSRKGTGDRRSIPEPSC